MGDEKVSEFEFALEGLEEIEDLGLDRDIEGGGGLVADEQGRAHDESPGNADALALAAAKGVGKSEAVVGGKADARHDFGDAFVALASVCQPVNDEGFGDNIVDGHSGVERRVGVLKDHLSVLADRR